MLWVTSASTNQRNTTKVSIRISESALIKITIFFGLDTHQGLLSRSYYCVNLTYQKMHWLASNFPLILLRSVTQHVLEPNVGIHLWICQTLLCGIHLSTLTQERGCKCQNFSHLNLKIIFILQACIIWHTQHRTAVNISSRALANVFSIELRDRRNSDVAIPIAALFSTIIKTPGAPNTLPNSYKHRW